jgi:ATP-dependent Clp protease ATP-binding subunit ClpC
MPFTKAAKDVLESALQEALTLKHSWIGSEHVLLALLTAGGRPVEILEKLGAKPDALRAEIDRLLAEAA